MAHEAVPLSRAQVVARNVAYNFASQLWFLALGVVTTPYIVRELGIDVYGLFVLLASLMGYFAFLDLGLGVATIKYLSEYHGRGDRRAVERIVGTSFGAYLLLGGLGGVAIALSSSVLVDRVLDVPGSLGELARAALYLSAIGFLVNMPLSVFAAVPTALQRMDLTNRRNIGFGTASLVGTVVLLALGYGLLEVVILTGVVSVLAAVSFFVLARRLLPCVSFRPRFHPPTFRLLSGFGALKFANQLSTQTVYHLDKFLVGALVSVTAVAYYAVPVALAQRLAAVVANVSSAFLPAASELHGQEDRHRFEELYFRATKLVAIIVLPIGSLLFVFSDPILRFWLGPDFAEESSVVLKALAAGYVINAFTTIPAVASDSVGRPRVTTGFSLASGALNVGLSLLLIPPFGILGASVAILANSAILAPVFLYYVHRKVLRLSVVELIQRSLARPVLATALSWPAMLMLLPVARSATLLVLALVLGLALSVVLSLALNVYDEAERRLARHYLARTAAWSAVVRVRTP